MKKQKEMLLWVSASGFVLLSLVMCTAVNMTARGSAKRDTPKAQKASPKYGIASGADQVLSAVYDPSTQTIRVEGAGISGGGGTVSSIGLSMPSTFSVTGGPITSTGILSVNWAQPVSVINGGTGQTSPAAAFNALAPATSAGGLIYGTGLNTYGNLTLGASGQCLGSNGVTLVWTACGSGTTITLAGDLSGTSTSQTVVGLQGHALSASAPVGGQVLEWNSAASAWTPTALPPFGTVSAVGLTAPAIFNVAGSPITSSGTLAFSLATQAANLVLAGPPSGAAAVPSFRALVGADLPAVNLGVNGAGGVTGTLSVASGGTGLTSAGATGQCLSSSGASLVWTACGTGTVTSVSLALPTGFVSGGSPVTTTGTLGVSMPSGWGAGALLVGNGANSVAALSLGTTGQCLTSNGATALWGSCGTGSGSGVFQVNGANASSQTPINFQSGGYITVSNPSAGDIQFNFSGPLAPVNGGTGLTTLGASGQCLGTNGAAMVWQSCGSAGAVTLETNGASDASQSALNLVNGANITFANTSGGSVTASVSGTLAASAIPAINLGASGDGGVTGTLSVGNGGTGLAAVGASGTCLTSTGSAMAWSSCAASGSMGIGGAVSGATNSSMLYINGSGQLAQDQANFNWNDAAKTLTVGNVVINGGSASQTLTLPTAAMQPGPGAAISIGSNTGNVPSISANGGTVTPIAPISGDLTGSWTGVTVGSFHLTGEGDVQASAVTTEIPNEQASNSAGMQQTFSASGAGGVITFTTAGYQPFIVGDAVSVSDCGSFDAGSLSVASVTSTTFTVNNSATGSQPSCLVASSSLASRSGSTVTLRIYPQPFGAYDAVVVAGCSSASFDAPNPVALTGVSGGSITFTLAGAGTTASGCTVVGGTQVTLLAKITPQGARFPLPTDTSVPVYPVASGAGVSGNAHLALLGQASCVMDATASGVEGEPVVADGSECHATAAPGSAYVVGSMVSNSTTAGSAATVGLGAGYLAGSGGSSTAFQLNGTSISAQSPINFESGTGITLSNPSAGNVLISSSGGGSSAWSSLANATGNLTLANGAFTTTFDQTGPAAWSWVNTTGATATVPVNSPALTLTGANWSGGGPSTNPDSWTIQATPVSGANAASYLTFSHSGSSTSTVAALQIPGGVIGGVSGELYVSSTTNNLVLGAPSGYGVALETGGNDRVEVDNNYVQIGQTAGYHLASFPAGNTDIRGVITISAATSASYTFATAFTDAPVCVLTPTSNPGALTWWATTSTTAVTANLSASGTVSFNYFCVGSPD